MNLPKSIQFVSLEARDFQAKAVHMETAPSSVAKAFTGRPGHISGHAGHGRKSIRCVREHVLLSYLFRHGHKISNESEIRDRSVYYVTGDEPLML